MIGAIRSKKWKTVVERAKKQKAPTEARAFRVVATQAYKRDSVPLSGRLSFLYACSHPQAEATYPKTRTSSPTGPCGPASSYLDLQPIRFTPPGCHHPMRELLPHVFTLTSFGGGNFLWHLLLPFRAPSCWEVWCSVLSRLSSCRLSRRATVPLIAAAKIRIN